MTQPHFEEKKTFIYFALLLFLLSLGACNPDKPGTDNPGGGTPPNTANLKAGVSKNYTVSLTWDAVSAQKVVLERKLGDDADFAQLADVTGKASFEDFPVLDDLSYTYRLSVDGKANDVTLSVPAVTANPRSVVITGDSSKAVTQSILTTGGTMTATGADGTVYTLTIPEGALLAGREITLTPVSEIDNLPLSGGLLGAVQISPEIEFYAYATLSIQPAKTLPANTTAIGFASENTGAEFYLRSTQKTAKTILQPQQVDNSPPELPTLLLDRPGTHGVGAGTSEDVREQVQTHPPTSPSDQMGQVSDSDVPLPSLSPLTAANTERRIRRNLANTQVSLQDTFRQYRQWLEYLRQEGLEGEFAEQIKQLSKDMANKISQRFDELYEKCQREPKVVQEMEALVNWASKYPALVQNLGEAFFNEARDRIELCKPTTWEGTISYTYDSPVLSEQITANVTWTYVGDESVGGILMQKYVPTGDASVTIEEKLEICTYTASNIQIDTAEEFNFLFLDYSSTPPQYNFDIRVRFTETSRCQGTPPRTTTRALDLMTGLGEISVNEIKGSRTVSIGGTTSTNNYTFTKKTN